MEWLNCRCINGYGVYLMEKFKLTNEAKNKMILAPNDFFD